MLYRNLVISKLNVCENPGKYLKPDLEVYTGSMFGTPKTIYKIKKIKLSTYEPNILMSK